MFIGIDSLSSLLAQTEQQQKQLPHAPNFIPCPLPSPPLSDKDSVVASEPSSSDLLPSTPAPSLFSKPYQFPIQIVPLPNKGRSYVATRRIQPGELVFIAKPLGTTLCDQWLDCGICYYCWRSIPDLSTSVRLPERKQSSKQRIETVMVFCNTTCLKSFQEPVAQRICQVEQRIRRSWNYASATRQSLGYGRKKSKRSPVQETGLEPTKSVQAIREVVRLAGSRKRILELDDQRLDQFLTTFWTALDTHLQEEEILFLKTNQLTEASSSRLDSTAKPRLLERAQALYPFLTKQLFGGPRTGSTDDDQEYELATVTSDDDCEMIRLITEVLLRGQADVGLDTTGDPSIELQPTFADYCAMQSNELVLFRKELAQQEDMLLDESTKIQDQEVDANIPLAEMSVSQESDFYSTWGRVRSLIPDYLHNCLYVYLRIRDAYFLLSLENNHTYLSDQGQDTTNDNDLITQRSPLSIDHFHFRTILFREVANSFGIRDEADELLGFAVFPRACFFNHSCRSNIEKRLNRLGTCHPLQQQKGGMEAPRQMEYWSRQVIEEGEECCISYGDMTPGRAERQERLEEEYFFRCCCPRCVEEANAEKSESA
ncbi:hypothetical protein BGW38_001451 [Lunasporangiospora selenospora]|uniref:SET domain-containing protein n=1 Tax=Lunasporangiospora selenospora TaxID=979761 RepID=A0A9P6FUM4_9FUNG|nr:hypothetical protein BGW38_001451 [Lunasporangiospora selenospora]